MDTQTPPRNEYVRKVSLSEKKKKKKPSTDTADKKYEPRKKDQRCRVSRSEVDLDCGGQYGIGCGGERPVLDSSQQKSGTFGEEATTYSAERC